MKICIPVETSEGLKARIFAHFGSAPYFLLYDTEREASEVLGNIDNHHAHGMCHPLKVLENRHIDAVVCAGMGARAVQKLNEGGMRTYRANGATGAEIINKYKQGILEEITLRNACADHSCR
jgi:predicted Fe-Mo cluster-binding NifX family protein